VAWLVIIIRPTREQNKLRKAKFCIRVLARTLFCFGPPEASGMLHFYAICLWGGAKILALGAANTKEAENGKKPCPGNCIFASQQIKLQQGRERRNFY